MRYRINRSFNNRKYLRATEVFPRPDGEPAIGLDIAGRRGIPRELCLLLGSRDAFAADHTVCQILGQNPEKLPILSVARRMGLYEGEVEIDSGGPMPAVSGFRVPLLTPLTYGPAREPIHYQGCLRRSRKGFAKTP